jgi:outer membrane immunogenic protein
MRRHSLILLAAATIGLAASQASAADLPRKAPAYVPPPPPPVTWTGCYIGANIGGAFSHASLNGAAGTVSSNGDGFAGGGQIGCDYQFTGGFVVGIRNMFDGTSNKRSGTIGAGPGVGTVVNFNNQWFDTLTARIGYSFQPAWLLYLQGGGAWAHTSTNATFNGVQVGQTSHTGTGWTIGGGGEWMFAPHWSAFIEANWMDLGSRSGTIIGTNFCVAPGCGFNAKATETTVLVGVNYRFF